MSEQFGLMQRTMAFEKNQEIKTGALRVWYAYYPGTMDKFLVPDVDAAIVLIKRLDKGWHPSLTREAGVAAGLEAFNVDGIEGWSEWYDEDGRDIQEIMEAETGEEE